MPKYYCDYCDCYLVSSSIAVRKQHNNGAKHKANVKAYYLQFIQEKTQKTIDDTIANFEMMRNSGMLPAGMPPGMGRGGMPPGMGGMPPGMMGGSKFLLGHFLRAHAVPRITYLLRSFACPQCPQG